MYYSTRNEDLLPSRLRNFHLFGGYMDGRLRSRTLKKQHIEDDFYFNSIYNKYTAHNKNEK